MHLIQQVKSSFCSKKILKRHSLHIFKSFKKNFKCNITFRITAYLRPHFIIRYRANDDIVIMVKIHFESIIKNKFSPFLCIPGKAEAIQ